LSCSCTARCLVELAAGSCVGSVVVVVLVLLLLLLSLLLLPAPV
jgi:hypothetical protein